MLGSTIYQPRSAGSAQLPLPFSARLPAHYAIRIDGNRCFHSGTLFRFDRFRDRGPGSVFGLSGSVVPDRFNWLPSLSLFSLSIVVLVSAERLIQCGFRLRFFVSAGRNPFCV